MCFGDTQYLLRAYQRSVKTSEVKCANVNKSGSDKVRAREDFCRINLNRPPALLKTAKSYL